MTSVYVYIFFGCLVKKYLFLIIKFGAYYVIIRVPINYISENQFKLIICTATIS